MDLKTLLSSIKKTGRVVICEEDCKTGGVGAEIWTQISEYAFDYIDAPPIRLAGKDIPIPFTPLLEEASVPDKNQIIKAVKEII